MKDKSMFRGILLVALSAACYGLMPTFAKLAYAAGTSLYTLLLLRFSVGAVFMFVLIRIKKAPLPQKGDILRYFLLGAIGYVSHSFCFFTALDLAPSSVVSLLLYTYPALVMLGSAAFFKEKITLRKVISLLLAVGGAFVIIGTELGGSSFGIMMAVLCAFGYSAYILVSARLVKQGEGMQSSAFIMLGAAVGYALMNLGFGFAPPTNMSGMLGVVLLALISTALGFWAFFTGMEKTGPAKAALVSTVEPVITVISSALLLHEPLTASVILGGVLVLGGLVITSLPTKE